MTKCVAVEFASGRQQDVLLKRSTDKTAVPRHLLVAVSYSGAGARFAFFHTSGSQVVWSAPARELACHRRFVRGLSPEDALELGFTAGMEASENRRHQDGDSEGLSL